MAVKNSIWKYSLALWACKDFNMLDVLFKIVLLNATQWMSTLPV